MNRFNIRLAEHAESLKAAQKKLLSDSWAYVSAHPMKSLGMAIVVGLLLGHIVGYVGAPAPVMLEGLPGALALASG